MNASPRHSPDVVAALPWVRALRPSGAPFWAPLVPGRPLQVWHVPVTFDLWTPSREQSERWASSKEAFVAETWQKNPLVVGQDSGCVYSCGEVELAARLRNAGLSAVWMSEWSGFPHVPAWEPFCVKRNEFERRANTPWKVDQDLRRAASARELVLGRQGGHPDVVGWAGGGRFVYVEYKGPGDKIKPKQYDWAQTLHLEHPDEVRYVAAYGTAR